MPMCWGRQRACARAAAYDDYLVNNSGVPPPCSGCKGLSGTTWAKQSGAGHYTQEEPELHGYLFYQIVLRLRRSPRLRAELLPPRSRQTPQSHRARETRPLRTQPPHLLQALPLVRDRQWLSTIKATTRFSRSRRNRTDNRNPESIHIHIHRVRVCQAWFSKSSRSRTDHRNPESIHIHIHRVRVLWQASLSKVVQIAASKAGSQSARGCCWTDRGTKEERTGCHQVPVRRFTPPGLQEFTVYMEMFHLRNMWGMMAGRMSF